MYSKLNEKPKETIHLYSIALSKIRLNSDLKNVMKSTPLVYLDFLLIQFCYFFLKKICQTPRLNRRTYLGPIQQMKFLSHLPNHSKENSFGVVQYDSLHPPELGKKKEDKLVNWIEYFLTR